MAKRYVAGAAVRRRLRSKWGVRVEGRAVRQETGELLSWWNGAGEKLFISVPAPQNVMHSGTPCMRAALGSTIDTARKATTLSAFKWRISVAYMATKCFCKLLVIQLLDLVTPPREPHQAQCSAFYPIYLLLSSCYPPNPISCAYKTL